MSPLFKSGDTTAVQIGNIESILAQLGLPTASLRGFMLGTSTMGTDMWIQTAGFQPNSGASGNFAPALGSLIAVPFLPPLNVSLNFTGLAFDQIVAGTAGSVTRVGLYTNNPLNNQPAQLVIDGGSVATDAANGVKVAAVNFSVQPTLHWMTILCGTAAPTVAGFAASTMTDSLFGYSSGTPNAAFCGWQVAFAFAALPVTFPVGATLRQVSAGAPVIMARLA